MATTKAVTAMENGLTLTAGAGDDTGTAVTLDDGYGAQISLKLTNGATGPTVAAQIQIQVSQDNSEWYSFGGPLVGNTDNSGVSSWSVEIPIGVEYVRTVQGSNTGQNVTCDIDLSEVTAVS
jgi:hypothetical protein